MQRALTSTENFGSELEQTSLDSGRVFPSDNWLALQLEEVSKIIQLDTGTFGTERAAFFTEIGGFDTHGTVNIASRMRDIDDALAVFSAELKDQGVWDGVTVIVASEFGRTLDTNGQGTDHGWGGNYFVVGGGVKGAQMLGQYPNRLIEFESDANVGRGRMIPTTPWEAVWNAVSEWWDIGPADRDEILPNKANFGADAILTRAQLFDN